MASGLYAFKYASGTIANLDQSSSSSAPAPARSVQGVIVDPSGVAVANAPVTLIDDAEQQGGGRLTTQSDGTFVFPSLHPAQFKLGIQGAGFKTYGTEFSSIRVAVRRLISVRKITISLTST
jgi:hypothetical protein